MTSDFDTIRAALRDNGVFRYGEYERSNTPPALAALARVQAAADEAEKALAWYADAANHRLTLHELASGRNSMAVDDGGYLARAALAALASPDVKEGTA